jgi:hypothetical protein
MAELQAILSALSARPVVCAALSARHVLIESFRAGMQVFAR